MTLTLTASPIEPPTVAPRLGVHLVPAAPGLWRVSNMHGHVIGHLQVMCSGSGVGYRARRFHAASRAFRDLGEFWSADEALECLVFAR